MVAKPSKERESKATEINKAKQSRANPMWKAPKNYNYIISLTYSKCCAYCCMAVYTTSLDCLWQKSWIANIFRCGLRRTERKNAWTESERERVLSTAGVKALTLLDFHLIPIACWLAPSLSPSLHFEMAKARNEHNRILKSIIKSFWLPIF